MNLSSTREYHLTERIVRSERPVDRGDGQRTKMEVGLFGVRLAFKCWHGRGAIFKLNDFYANCFAILIMQKINETESEKQRLC
jgi:hypothetical protein